MGKSRCNMDIILYERNSKDANRKQFANFTKNKNLTHISYNLMHIPYNLTYIPHHL